MANGDNQVAELYLVIEALKKRVADLESNTLQKRIVKIEKAQKIIITFCASLEPLILSLKTFKIFNFNIGDE